MTDLAAATAPGDQPNKAKPGAASTATPGCKRSPSVAGECGATNDVLILRCVREAGHDGYHIHDDGNAVAAWAPDTDRRPR